VQITLSPQLARYDNCSIKPKRPTSTSCLLQISVSRAQWDLHQLAAVPHASQHTSRAKLECLCPPLSPVTIAHAAAQSGIILNPIVLVVVSGFMSPLKTVATPQAQHCVPTAGLFPGPVALSTWDSGGIHGSHLLIDGAPPPVEETAGAPQVPPPCPAGVASLRSHPASFSPRDSQPGERNDPESTDLRAPSCSATADVLGLSLYYFRTSVHLSSAGAAPVLDPCSSIP
jgi:hypothetical protein